MIRGMRFSAENTVDPKHGDLYVEQDDDGVTGMKFYDGTDWQPCLTVRDILITKMILEWEEELGRARDLEVKETVARHIAAVRELVAKARHEMKQP